MGSHLVHSVRNGIRGPEITYSLSDDGLSWRGDGAAQLVPFAEITELTLSLYPADIADEEEIHGQLVIKTATGESLTVRSHHCKSLGSYENRAASYAPFVRALCQGVAAANPKARFTTGSGLMRLLWLILLVVTGAGSALLMIVLLAGEATRGLFLMSAVCLGAAALSWNMLRANQRQEFDGSDPPTALLEL